MTYVLTFCEMCLVVLIFVLLANTMKTELNARLRKCASALSLPRTSTIWLEILIGFLAWGCMQWSRHMYMMTSSNGNISRVTGTLCGEFTGLRWIPPAKASDAGLWWFLWSAPWINGWVNNRKAGVLRRYRAQYDVIVMTDCDPDNSLKPVMDLSSINAAEFKTPNSPNAFIIWCFCLFNDINQE